MATASAERIADRVPLLNMVHLVHWALIFGYWTQFRYSCEVCQPNTSQKNTKGPQKTKNILRRHA